MVMILPTIVFRISTILGSSFLTDERLNSFIQLGRLAALFYRLVYMILPSGGMGINTEWDQTFSITFKTEKKPHLIGPHLPALVSFFCVWNGVSSCNLLLSFASYEIQESQWIAEQWIQFTILHSFLAANRCDIFKALVHKALMQIIQWRADIYLAQNQTVLFSSGMSKSATITDLCFTSVASVHHKRLDIKDCFSNRESTLWYSDLSQMMHSLSTFSL